MTRSRTTSIRLSPELRAELERAAHQLHRGKNWIIVHALQAYLAKLQFDLLADEARRQSLLVSKMSKAEREEAEDWEDLTDTADWE